MNFILILNFIKHSNNSSIITEKLSYRSGGQDRLCIVLTKKLMSRLMSILKISWN